MDGYGFAPVETPEQVIAGTQGLFDAHRAEVARRAAIRERCDVILRIADRIRVN